MADEGLTARERRAIRVKDQSRRDAPKKVGKSIGFLLVAVLVVAGVVWGIQHLPDRPTRGHSHNIYRMFAGGDEVSFNYDQFSFENTGYLDSHLHIRASAETTSAQYVIHAEGLQGTVSYGTFLETLGVVATKSKVTFAPVQGREAAANNATHEWQVWIDRCGGEADDFSREGKLFGYIPKPHDRTLMTFAPKDATRESLQPEWSQIPSETEFAGQLNEAVGAC